MSNTASGPKPTLNNQAYNVLKFIALIVLPALATLYFAVAQIWGLPKAAEVVGTITVVDTFLGALLGISSNNYNKNTAENQLKSGTDIQTDGALVIDTVDPMKDTYSFELETPFDKLAEKDTITLKVKSNTGEIADDFDTDHSTSE